MNTPKRYFLQWVLLALTYSVLAFFAYQLGIFKEVWTADFTHVTAVIAGMFIISCLYLGFATWRADKNPIKANADANLGRHAIYLVTIVAILGTALGLMSQVAALSALNPNDVSGIAGFIGSIGSSLKTALYATCTGIIASNGITIMTANLEHALDSDSK